MGKLLLRIWNWLVIALAFFLFFVSIFAGDSVPNGRLVGVGVVIILAGYYLIFRFVKK